MNNPSAQPIDIDEQRNWLNDHRVGAGFSWSEIGKRIGIPAGTISQFGTGGYKGDNQNLAEKIYRYQQLLAAQAQISIEAPEVPGYFSTPTSEQLIQLLHKGQRGRIVVAAMAPGTCKTMSAKHFTACQSNVFMTTLTPSRAGVNNMQIAVLRQLGEPNAVGTPQKLSDKIMARVEDLQNPLLIFDEAQHASEKSIEEIRSWHDLTGVGIALLGNIKVMRKLEGGSRDSSFAQIFSRVSLKMSRAAPLQSDCDALAQAWGVFGDQEVAFIRKIGVLPGGLRGATFMLELGSTIALAEKQPLAVSHLQDAWAQLSSRAVAA